MPTIGAAFSTKCIQVKNQNIKFEIWDTAGQERYRSLAPMYYRGARFAVVVYDITCKDSFNGAKVWIQDLKNNRNNVIIILVGNKLDLEEKRVISKEEAMSYCKNKDILFLETSAKSGDNINKIFYQLAEKELESPLSNENDNVIRFSNTTTKNNKCC